MIIGGVQMSNEEFQRVVLEELSGLREGQKELETGFKQLKSGQKELEIRIRQLEIGQEEIKRDLKGVIEQTADLTEFRNETNEKLDHVLGDNRIVHEI